MYGKIIYVLLRNYGDIVISVQNKTKGKHETKS